MPLGFNPLKSRDKYFQICKVATLLVCLPWPLTLLASVMSLAGTFPSDTPTIVRILVRLGWLLLLIYPAVFFAIQFFAERVVAPKSYPAGVALALAPIAASAGVIVWRLR